MTRVSGSQPTLPHAAQGAEPSLHKIMFYLKWVVYSLLIVNFGLYLAKDITAAQHTITAATPFTGWLTSFAASMDQFAWVALIFIYEIETYWLDDDFNNKLVESLMLAGKVIFAIMILNTIVSYTSLVLDIEKMSLMTPAGGLCGLADQGFAFLRNLAYTPITSESCGTIPYAQELFKDPKDPVITDTVGLAEDSAFRILDLIEAISWFAILGLTELSVRWQDRGIHEGALVNTNRIFKTALYIIIGLVSVFWLLKGHYMYVWDEFLWIASFVALDGNLSAWRDELAQDAEDANSAVASTDLDNAPT